MGLLSKIGGSLATTLDFVSAVAKNPITAIANPKKAVSEIKEIRTSGTTSQRLGYIKDVAITTATEAALVVGGSGALGAKAATVIKSGATTAALGTGAAAILAPKTTQAILSSPEATKTAVASAINPVAGLIVGVEQGTSVLKTAISENKGSIIDTAKDVLTGVGLVAGGAGLVAAGKAIYDKVKENDVLPTDTNVPSTSLTPTIATNQSTPVVPATTTVTTGTTSVGGKTKRKKYKKKREVPYINIKIDNREDNDVNDRKVYKGGRF
jgi:hypothetical protein